ncbi:MAG: SCP2 sterol-binding domain-containing protein [Acidimicrobiia bacterium]
MAAFLSAEWLQDLDRAARASPALTEIGRAGELVVEQHVTGTPTGDVSYHVVIDGDGARVVNGPAPEANIVITTDFATAVSLHAGDMNAQRALASGSLKLTGDIDQLVQRSDALKALDDVFASIRATTTVTVA